MTRKILVGLTSAVVVAVAVALAGTEGAWAAHDGRHHRNQTPGAKRARRPASRKSAARHRVRAGRKANHVASTYSCPMHPDVREKAAGTCPKCLMNLERETAKARQ